MEYYNEDFLMHYGVKGMKWGVRRYQNADGTLTNAGKKRLAKSIQKRYKQTDSLNDRNALEKDIADELADNYRQHLDSHIKNIREKRQFSEKVSKIRRQAWKSEDFENANKHAMDDAYEWFKKNKPDRLKKLLEECYDDKYALLDVDDWEYDSKFIKFRDKYEDEVEKRYLKNAGINLKDADSAGNEYYKACEEAASFVVGRYGYIDASIKGVGRRNVESIVSEAIRELEKNDR